MTTAVATPSNLLGLDGLSASRLEGLLDRAEGWLDVVRGQRPPEPLLAGKVIANLFLEDSTRTRVAFTVAAHRLGATCVDLTTAGSSVSKGETLLDTAITLTSMGVDGLVVRVSGAGGPAELARHVPCPVINAGDGRHEHPTQGLLDALTLRERLGDLDGRRIAIVGDLLNSRVARSNIFGLTTLGARVVLVGPPELVPLEFGELHPAVEVAHELDPLLPELDAIMMLRVQFERGSAVPADYRARFALTSDRVRRLPPEAPVLHPGPMNRGLEIDDRVADDPERSVIRTQVTNGVAVRMAVFEWLIGGRDPDR